MSGAKFEKGDHVEKISGSSWRGRVVGTYSTDLTPEGYAVESDTEKGSVQIYPAKALRLSTPSQRLDAATVERCARYKAALQDIAGAEAIPNDAVAFVWCKTVATEALATDPHQHGGKGA